MNGTGWKAAVAVLVAVAAMGCGAGEESQGAEEAAGALEDRPATAGVSSPGGAGSAQGQAPKAQGSNSAAVDAGRTTTPATSVIRPSTAPDAGSALPQDGGAEPQPTEPEPSEARFDLRVSGEAFTECYQAAGRVEVLTAQLSCGYLVTGKTEATVDPTGQFTATLPGVLAEGGFTDVFFFADMNGNGVCEGDVDQVWKLEGVTATADVSLQVSTSTLARAEGWYCMLFEEP